MSRRFFISLLTLLLVSANWAAPFAQTADFKYFDETGHNVQGDFLKFYTANPNALLVFGYPISEAFPTKSGLTVQYFQRARFELHPELPEGQRVTLTALGAETYKAQAAMSIAVNKLACKTFATGFDVCYDFLQFYEKHGGVNQFGNPISAFEYRDEKVVQYFERARFEWLPGRPESQRVVLTDLGRIYFDKLGEDPALLQPVKPMDNSQSAILRIKARAFLKKAIASTDDAQALFIVLQDQNSRPVSNAACNASLLWPNQRTETLSVNTNANGVGILPFSFSQQPRGSVVYINVACQYKTLTANTVASFRIWY
ncbi:MAG: hypothetical protein IT310_01275 [Anaerolineales bacterium]|nr:hypothetical protein [Anaerolineales bacterium]